MIFDIAAKRAELSPECPAVYFAGRWYRYGELNDRATKLAGRLAEMEVAKGDRVSILAANHLAHIELILATAKLGFVYTPFNYRLSAAEQRTIADYVRPKRLFFDAEHADKAHATGVASIPLETYDDWLADAPPPPQAPSLDPEDIQMILFTGGTTGSPKGALQPYRQGFYNALNTVFSWHLRGDDCAVQATPCFHAAVNALSVPLLHLGAQVVLQRQFDPGEYLQLADEQNATVLFMVPTMYQMLTQHPTFATSDLSRVRWAISGGAPCPEPVREAFAARGVRFKQGYGLTEAGVNCFSVDLETAERKPSSVGRPVLHAEAAIRAENGQPVRPGEIGELTLHGPHVFSGYFERPDDTAKNLRDGWLWTGDLAQQDDEGDYRIVGRRKEMFISGGENIYPVEIENALYEHGAVAECAVMGVPDARWGEVGLAAIILREDAALGEQDVRAHLKARIAGYKLPKHILFLAAFPKSGAGKILKHEIAAEFLDASSLETSFLETTSQASSQASSKTTSQASSKNVPKQDGVN